MAGINRIGGQRSGPDALLSIVRIIHRGSGRTSGLCRGYWAERAGEMGRRFREGADHVLVTLYAISPEAMTSYSERLSALFAEGDRFS